jgi:uncharacterized protein YbjT (DUF2867 family)
MILIAGATGMLGKQICRLLATQGKPVRGLVRITSDPSTVEQLKEMGLDSVEGNVRDRSSLDAACQGVTALISTVSAIPYSYDPADNNLQQVDRDGMTNLIHAAQDAGVHHFVYTSFSGNLDLDFPLRNAKRRIEQRLKDSGLTFTILRPSCFMETWLSPAMGFDYANAKAQIFGSGDNPLSWISLYDVAQFAVESLENPTARNVTLELGGPEALNPLEVIRIFEEAGGRSFEVEYVPAKALEEQQRATEDPMAQSFAGLMRCYAQGDSIDMRSLRQAFPIELTSVEAYAERVLGTT